MKLESAVCFFAHPDDETVLAGGLIAMMAAQGIAVHVVCATRGEGGELGDPPVTHDRSQLGTIREAELRCAVTVLGATVAVLGYVDPVIGLDDVLLPFDADLDALASQFVSMIRRKKANLVLTHGGDGEYGHPAHQLVNRAALKAIQHAAPEALLYTLAANVPAIEDRLWNKNEPAHLALDIRPWAEAKLEAMECHRSQHALFKRRRELQTIAEALRTVESVRRQWPPTHDEPPQDVFATLLRTCGAWEPMG